MGKVTDRGLVPPDDPLFLGKLRIYSKPSRAKMIALGPIERYVVSDWVTGSHTDCDSKEAADEVYERLTALGHECMILQIRNRIGPYS